MAQDANGQTFCKVVHTENGRTSVRRVNTILVQAADGRLFHLKGKGLPDSISLFTGSPYRGEHLAQVLMNPEGIKGIPLLLDRGSWFSKRDIFFWVLGMYSISLVSTITDAIALVFG